MKHQMISEEIADTSVVQWEPRSSLHSNNQFIVGLERDPKVLTYLWYPTSPVHCYGAHIMSHICLVVGQMMGTSRVCWECPPSSSQGETAQMHRVHRAPSRCSLRFVVRPSSSAVLCLLVVCRCGQQVAALLQLAVVRCVCLCGCGLGPTLGDLCCLDASMQDAAVGCLHHPLQHGAVSCQRWFLFNYCVCTWCARRCHFDAALVSERCCSPIET